MSLINEALKKARDKNSPSVAPQSRHAPARGMGSPPPQSVGYGMWVVATVVVSGFAAVLFYFLRSPQQNVVAANPPPPAAPQAPSGVGGPRNVSTVPPPPAIETPTQAVQPPPPPPPQPVVQTPPPVQVQQPPAVRLPRPNLRVQATMVFPDSRTAIINGREYLEGEEVDGATVVEIKLNGVRLRFNGEEYFLKNN